MILDQSVQIDDKTYFIDCVIGEGAAGIVYHVKDKDNKHFALKLIKNYTKDRVIKQLVDQQIQIQKSFKYCQFVIHCYGKKIVNNNIYILLQLGQFSLRNRIQINHLIQLQYIQMLIDVSQGLMSIHQKKMIHRDIKPENIIYSKGTFKITDFGISIQKEKTSDIVGTGLYWAPEILYSLDDEKQHEYTNAVDVWSFGVMAFQAYFLIHPFFYPFKGEECRSMKDMIRQLKKNIQALLPQFTFEKLLKHLRQCGITQKANFIQNKLKQTNKQLIQTFKYIFNLKPRNRQSIQMLLGLFQSIQQFQLTQVQNKQCKIIKKQIIRPPDVYFFVEGLNLFYELNKNMKYTKDEEVEYVLQLGLRFLTLKQYNGENFVTYYCKQKILKYKDVKKEQYKKIKNTLEEYYFYLKGSKEIQFFKQLHTLQIFICLCSRWYMIAENVKMFTRKVQKITGIQCSTLEDFRQILPALTERQLSSIENLIISQYE